jgi:phage shock protein PspC (stress-responsive transcriptional regulator)
MVGVVAGVAEGIAKTIGWNRTVGGSVNRLGFYVVVLS